jgi:hypothetical protein
LEEDSKQEPKQSDRYKKGRELFLELFYKDKYVSPIKNELNTIQQQQQQLGYSPIVPEKDLSKLITLNLNRLMIYKEYRFSEKYIFNNESQFGILINKYIKEDKEKNGWFYTSPYQKLKNAVEEMLNLAMELIEGISNDKQSSITLVLNDQKRNIYIKHAQFYSLLNNVLELFSEYFDLDIQLEVKPPIVSVGMLEWIKSNPKKVAGIAAFTVGAGLIASAGLQHKEGFRGVFSDIGKKIGLSGEIPSEEIPSVEIPSVEIPKKLDWSAEIPEIGEEFVTSKTLDPYYKDLLPEQTTITPTKRFREEFTEFSGPSRKTITPETVAPTTVVPEAVVPTGYWESFKSKIPKWGRTPEAITPETVAPTTVVPETVVPTTVVPETVAPTKWGWKRTEGGGIPKWGRVRVSPTTVVPETVVPTTVVPTTVVPTTVAPTTVVPEAVVPTTITPETVDPGYWEQYLPSGDTAFKGAAGATVGAAGLYGLYKKRRPARQPEEEKQR